MGCAGSTPKVDENSKKLKRPKAWKHTQPITPARLKQMRDEFWDTAPHYGGQKDLGCSEGCRGVRSSPCTDHRGQCWNHRVEP
ncbi:Ubiquitin domain-containing protein [Zea mays]|uniref:Ubiquitin domain-containing protein n=1 Tax=Zea mays TaxID=4577 RepID=A0A1D6MAB6_MAIZE|nr:Ubiquitin domain-containing protein [Zea mays]